VYIFYLLC